MSRSTRNYQPAVPFNVAMRLLIPTITIVKGVDKKVYPKPEDSFLFYGSFRTFGGTESTINDVYTLVDTATINTWYNPQITADCQIYICETGATYEIMATPEDINMRHQFLQIKVQKIGGTA